MSEVRQKSAQELADSSSIGTAIRELRTQVGLTQVQFASELGITPTSIYRYEAGTSVPNAEVLTKLLQNAVSRQLFDVAQHFAAAWTERTGLTFSIEGTSTKLKDPLFQAISSLRPDRQLDVMAFVQMLENNTDPTADRMLRLLLEPWLVRAKQEFGPVDVAFKLGGNPVARDAEQYIRAERARPPMGPSQREPMSTRKTKF